MSLGSVEAQPPIHSKGLRQNKGTRRDQQRSSRKTHERERSRSKKLLLATHNALSKISYEVSSMNSRAASATNRIHSNTPPTQITTEYYNYTPIYNRTHRMPGGQENCAPVPQSLEAAADGRMAYASNYPQNDSKLPSQYKKSGQTDILQASSVEVDRGPTKVLFSESLVSEPARSAFSSRSRPSSPHRARKRTEQPPRQPSYARGNSQDSFGKLRARFEETSLRYPQGHKRPRAPSTLRVQPKAASAKDLDDHVKETATAISNLNSQVGSLNGTMSAVLPIVAEARLLWMENTIVQAATKLGTTRQAFCQYYESPKYLTYTGNIRTRAHYLGLTLQDLKYLQERLASLGEERLGRGITRETVLLSPFGGGNESGDRIMIESMRSDTKHGIYARRIWRLCYERAYSVDEGWSIPIPTPDNSKLVARIKTWLNTA